MKNILIFILLLQSSLLLAQHPRLTLTKKGIQIIREGLGTVPLFDQEFQLVQDQVNAAILKGIDVPIPKDMAGGYTHEQHKVNYNMMHRAGILYQLTEDEKYAQYVKEMLVEYADMYPTLSLHPSMKSYATGKIFWQCLNDANWLVFTSQAYDCIYDYLTVEERNHFETNLFKPFAHFLSEENPRFFNRIHNHSTWANASVGMMAIVMDDEELLTKALYGLTDDGIDSNEIDNDGGFIKKEGETKAGFLAQLDHSFSPDGYFSEGPYYQRYAIFPFLVFGQSLDNYKPELNIFEYNNSILKKATNSMLQLTDSKGEFFPINDALKGMSYEAFEIINAVDIMYSNDPSQVGLLDWAAKQGKVALNETGFTTAKALTNHDIEEPKKESIIFNDGATGEEGGVAVLRLNDLELLFKYSSQGMGHGHFDRLSYSLYSENGDVLQDYGAVRWVNVDQKGGGRYLPENKTFGKHTIAHNTVVLNKTSMYNASVKEAEEDHPDLFAYDFESEHVQMVSAIEMSAYENTSLHRAVFLMSDEDLGDSEIVLDLFQVNTDQPTTMDLPFWFVGDIMQTNRECQKELTSLVPLGDDYGYQHIWAESMSCTSADDGLMFNWLGNNQFFTLFSVSDADDQAIIGRAGANDPNFNIRPEPVYIHRKSNVQNHTFVNLIDAHGEYNNVTEIPIRPYSEIENLNIIFESEDYIICSFSNDKYTWLVSYSFSNNSASKKHKVKVDNQVYKWQGVYNIKKQPK